MELLETSPRHPRELIPAMTLNESIVEDGALEWFGEQCRGARNLT
jgi:hypothetical protein